MYIGTQKTYFKVFIISADEYIVSAMRVEKTANKNINFVVKKISERAFVKQKPDVFIRRKEDAFLRTKIKEFIVSIAVLMGIVKTDNKKEKKEIEIPVSISEVKDTLINKYGVSEAEVSMYVLKLCDDSKKDREFFENSVIHLYSFFDKVKQFKDDEVFGNLLDKGILGYNDIKVFSAILNPKSVENLKSMLKFKPFIDVVKNNPGVIKQNNSSKNGLDLKNIIINHSEYFKKEVTEDISNGIHFADSVNINYDDKKKAKP